MNPSKIKREVDTIVHPLGKRQKAEKTDEGNNKLISIFIELICPKK